MGFCFLISSFYLFCAAVVGGSFSNSTTTQSAYVVRNPSANYQTKTITIMLKHNIPKQLLNLARPIIKPKLFYLFFVLIFLQQSCTKIDNTEKVNTSEITTTEFFHSSKILSVGISKIVQKLKKEDLRSNFVKNLPKDCGLPIWDKLVVQRETKNLGNNASARENNSTSAVGGESSDVIIVPLTITNNSLSSILVATELNDSSWLISTKVVNHYLYYVTHDPTVDTSFSKKALALFLFMENNTFGTTIFHNIPANLFSDIHFIDHNGNKELKILNFDASQFDSLGVPIMSSRAMAYISHTEPEGIGHVPILQGSGWIYSCSFCPPAGWPTSGGGGGGGNPPPNPIGGGGCPWYNPSCNTPPPPPPVPPNPCQVVSALIASADYQNKLNYLKGKGGDDHETAILMINPATDMTYEVVNAAAGGADNGNVDFNPAVQIDAVLHNHYDATNSPIFSFSDIRKMYQLLKDGKIKNSKTFTLGVVTSTTSYLMMFDSTTFRNFGNEWLSDKLHYKSLEKLFYDIYKVHPNPAVVADKNLLKFLKHKNCGIKLFKGNSDLTSFLPIVLNGDESEVVNDANCGILSYNQ
jgi:hypothetical protein